MARESVIGQRIFERVEAMRADNPGMTQQDAFLALANEMDKKPATIGANYYRILRHQRKAEQDAKKAARAQSQAKQEGERRMEPQPKRKVVDRNGQVAGNLEEMAQVLHRQIDTLVQQYKAEHERMTKVRELVGG